MKTLFVGGGSLGPVTPLLALAKAMRAQEKGLECAWIGTPNGPERSFVEAEKIPFVSLSAVKLPRYVSLEWVVFPWRWFQVRKQARRLLQDIKPDLVVSMGGFTAAPIIRAAARQGIPCFTHQLDVEPGLTNRALVRVCTLVTTSFDYSRPPFGAAIKTLRVPTPVRYERSDMPTRAQAAHMFGLDAKKSVVFVYGGGQGAQNINQALEACVEDLLEYTQIIHITGVGKALHLQAKRLVGYVVRPLLSAQEMLAAHVLADVEVARGGIGSLSEIATLKKAAIIVPMAHSHQVANANVFSASKAIEVLDERAADFVQQLSQTILELLASKTRREEMGEKAFAVLPTDNGSVLAECILSTYYGRYL